MDQFPSNRAWMYDRNHRGRGALKVSFVFGVEEFITKACKQDRYHKDEGVRCPCIKCDCTKILEKRVVKVHLYKHGFKPNYLIWTDHGEQMPEGDLDNDVTSMGVEPDGERNDPFMLMQDMMHDVDRCTSSSSCVASNQSTPTTNATPSPPIHIPGTHSSSTVNELDVEEDFNHRPMIRPIGGGFYPSKTASKAITATIKQKFDQPWLTWGAIPKRERGLFFQCFKKKVSWRVEDEDKVLKIFHSKASHRLSEMFKKARKEGKKPNWMEDIIWNDLLEKWNMPMYQKKCDIAKKNHGSEKGGSLYTGGSISVHDHAIRLSQELGRPVYVDEIFQQTHIRQTTGDFVDERSRQTYEEFQTKFSQVMSHNAVS